eukprot:3920663-Amphidinium_carterae.1
MQPSRTLHCASSPPGYASVCSSTWQEHAGAFTWIHDGKMMYLGVKVAKQCSFAYDLCQLICASATLRTQLAVHVLALQVYASLFQHRSVTERSDNFDSDLRHWLHYWHL